MDDTTHVEEILRKVAELEKQAVSIKKYDDKQRSTMSKKPEL
jgi:hypothetical protein